MKANWNHCQAVVVYICVFLGSFITCNENFYRIWWLDTSVAKCGHNQGLAISEVQNVFLLMYYVKGAAPVLHKERLQLWRAAIQPKAVINFVQLPFSFVCEKRNKTKEENYIIPQFEMNPFPTWVLIWTYLWLMNRYSFNVSLNVFEKSKRKQKSSKEPQIELENIFK